MDGFKAIHAGPRGRLESVDEIQPGLEEFNHKYLRRHR